MTDKTGVAGKAYRSEEVTVFYDARRCLHVAECVRGLPEVFNPDVRPWIRPEGAAAAAVAETVRRCPTGALHYALEFEAVETGDETTQITPQPGGPLVICGRLSITTPAGELEETRAALCRCGQSGNKPFCDGTHNKVGWTG